MQNKVLQISLQKFINFTQDLFDMTQINKIATYPKTYFALMIMITTSNI